MNLPESNGRGLPSVNESRVRRVRLLQWLLVLGAFGVVALGVVWLAHSIRASWRGHTTDTTQANAMANGWNKRMFELPPVAAPAPPRPATVPAVEPVPTRAEPATRAQGAPNTAAKQGDQMMLTGGDGGRPTISQSSARVNQAGVSLASVQRDAGRDSGPLQGLLSGTHTERARAGLLGDRNMILAKGSNFDCILNTKLVSTVSGMVSCTVPRNVYSDNGKVVLIERGSMVTGEYRSDLQTGRERIFVLWDRIKTVDGVVIDLNSPATDSLGEAGVGGYVDNHWWQRIGASVLLSLVEDAFAYKTAQESSSGSGNSVVLLPSTSQQTQTLAGKILDNTINIPPTLSRNQGEKVSVFVARDLDFGSVYELRTE